MGINKKICFDTVITRKTGLDFTDIDREIVMMDIDKGKYYGFNSVGSRIWELIEKPITLKEVVEDLLKEFDVDDKICENSVLDFVNRIYNEKLITIN